ncbi:uncharacterized protein LOC100382393 [Zea mays]|nr:uncharacterized protein LOC100382393 [Zea mays]|eukprot:NP_001168609.2 uncharacterized protein LOC100382393 [Zea mays]
MSVGTLPESATNRPRAPAPPEAQEEEVAIRNKQSIPPNPQSPIPNPQTLGYLGAAAMAAAGLRKGNARLPPEVNRVLYVRNLPFNISSEEMYDIFGKYGAIRQIRLGNAKDTRGTAYVVYEDIYDAKNAVDHLSGFNVANRYLIVLYYQPAKMSKKSDIKKKEDEITRLQEKYGIGSKTPGPGSSD